eukprot:753523-Hanusia_phi.AAC.10
MSSQKSQQELTNPTFFASGRPCSGRTRFSCVHRGRWVQEDAVFHLVPLCKQRPTSIEQTNAIPIFTPVHETEDDPLTEKCAYRIVSCEGDAESRKQWQSLE